MVRAAVPEELGDAVLVAVIITVAGDGTVAGAEYNPVAEIVPTALLPPGRPLTLQFTVVVVVPVTVAVNCCVEPVWIVLAAGATLTLTAEEPVIWTVAAPDALATTLVAVTVTVLGKGTLLGAVKSPVEEIEPFAGPPLTLQVTPMFEVPVTVAMNCWVPLTATAVIEGATETATWPSGMIVTCVLADLVGSAVLVAVTVTVAGVGTELGAV